MVSHIRSVKTTLLSHPAIKRVVFFSFFAVYIHSLSSRAIFARLILKADHERQKIITPP